LHRDLTLAAVCLHVVGVFLIIYQAGRLYECSYKCNLEDWAKKMHVITGIAATALVLVQPIIAAVRPGPNSVLRPLYNWTHWFFGMTAWALAC
uniref:Cytochrome b561 domain-containing protein n=1 Tax=Gongylonema pulchrum TaxID=637853 RepID=A0A183ESQ6_9BILA